MRVKINKCTDISSLALCIWICLLAKGQSKKFVVTLSGTLNFPLMISYSSFVDHPSTRIYSMYERWTHLCIFQMKIHLANEFFMTCILFEAYKPGIFYEHLAHEFPGWFHLKYYQRTLSPCTSKYLACLFMTIYPMEFLRGFNPRIFP